MRAVAWLSCLFNVYTTEVIEGGWTPRHPTEDRRLSVDCVLVAFKVYDMNNDRYISNGDLYHTFPQRIEG